MNNSSVFLIFFIFIFLGDWIMYMTNNALKAEEPKTWVFSAKPILI